MTNSFLGQACARMRSKDQWQSSSYSCVCNQAICGYSSSSLLHLLMACNTAWRTFCSSTLPLPACWPCPDPSAWRRKAVSSAQETSASRTSMPRSSKASSTDTSSPARLLAIDTLIRKPLLLLLLLLLLSRSTDETLTCCTDRIHVHAWFTSVVHTLKIYVQRQAKTYITYYVRTVAATALPELLLSAAEATVVASWTLSLSSLMYFDASTRIDVLFACIAHGKISSFQQTETEIFLRLCPHFSLNGA